jgi:ribosome-associated protein
MIKGKSTSSDKKPSAGRRSVIRVLDESESLMKSVVKGMKDKKAKDITCIDLRGLRNSVADFFVVCHAESRTHIDAIARSVEETVYTQSGEAPCHCEGVTNAEWILLDYSNVVAHVFMQEKRAFYGIERLWADAPIRHVASNY